MQQQIPHLCLITTEDGDEIEEWAEFTADDVEDSAVRQAIAGTTIKRMIIIRDGDNKVVFDSNSTPARNAEAAQTRH